MPTLLAPDDIRPFAPDSGLEDADLQLLLDAADAEIIRFAGPLGAAEEWFGGGQQVLALSRPAASITSIVEHWDRGGTQVTLASDDYLIDPTGYLLYRLTTGTNPRWRWWGRVVVTYAPVDETAIRKGVELDLVRLMMTYSPGAQSETIGAWTQQLASNSAWNNSTERQAILARLVSQGRMLVVGG